MTWLYRFSATVIILFASCVGSLVLNFVFTQLALRGNYCTTDNRIYQSLRQISATDWYAKASISGEVVLETDNRRYIAEAYQNNNAPTLVYVSVGTERDSLRGTEGFLYLLPDQTIPQYWLENYWITYREGSIYCYKIRGF